MHPNEMACEVKILFIGDVVGRAGREKVISCLPAIQQEHQPDITIVNGENAAHGFGMTPAICRDFFDAGADVLTAGDHVWDQQTLPPYLSQEPRLLRPHNFPSTNPGKGYVEYATQSGKKVLVIHLLGQVFHKENLNCPFACVDEILTSYPLGRGNVEAIFVDMHCEATSEKNAMGEYLNGRVTAVMGTHTHVPTADGRILTKGTAYLTDAGMCGDYNSVIGFKSEPVLKRFLNKNKKHKMEVAAGPATLYAQFTIADDKTGLASDIFTQIY